MKKDNQILIIQDEKEREGILEIRFPNKNYAGTSLKILEPELHDNSIILPVHLDDGSKPARIIAVELDARSLRELLNQLDFPEFIGRNED